MLQSQCDWSNVFSAVDEGLRRVGDLGDVLCFILTSDGTETRTRRGVCVLSP